MSDSVLITIIICATLLILYGASRIGGDKK